MCRTKLFFAMFLFFFPNFALSQVKQVNSVGTSPLPWLSGVINGSYERRIKPEIGKTVIWPAEWTHAHAGEIVKSGKKYIITGWMNLPITSSYTQKAKSI